MARRVVAMLAIVVMIGLALALMWRVYEHRVRSGSGEDEPSVIAWGAPSAEKFTIRSL